MDVSTARADSNSAGFIGLVGAGAGLHPDFGGDEPGSPYGVYGMVYVVVPGSQPLEVVDFCEGYPDQSDPGAPGRPPGYPIPIGARTQPNWKLVGMVAAVEQQRGSTVPECAPEARIGTDSSSAVPFSPGPESTLPIICVACLHSTRGDTGYTRGAQSLLMRCLEDRSDRAKRDDGIVLSPHRALWERRRGSHST